MTTNDYLFGHDQVSIDRLNFQYDVCGRIFGNLIPDFILEDLKAKDANRRPKILDLATGTGIWMIDNNTYLQAKGVTADFRGIDLQTDTYPPQNTLPHNIEFAQQDMLLDVDEGSHNKYDIVHIRFVCWACNKEKLTQLCRNAFAFLKPGGWLMWEDIVFDVSMPRSDYSKELKGKQLVHAQKMFEDGMTLMVKSGIAREAIHELPAILVDLGFKNVKDDMYHSYTKDMEVRKDIQKIFRDSLVEALTLAEPKMKALGLHCQSMEEVRKELDLADSEEWCKGAGFDYVYQVLTAKKQ